jgi:hypothetical protein
MIFFRDGKKSVPNAVEKRYKSGGNTEENSVGNVGNVNVNFKNKKPRIWRG